MPTAQTATKPSETSTKEIQKPNGKITNNESKKTIRENNGKKIYITEKQTITLWQTQ